MSLFSSKDVLIKPVFEAMSTKNVTGPFGYNLGVLTTTEATQILHIFIFCGESKTYNFLLNTKFNFLNETSLPKQAMQYDVYCNLEGLKRSDSGAITFVRVYRKRNRITV